MNVRVNSWFLGTFVYLLNLLFADPNTFFLLIYNAAALEGKQNLNQLSNSEVMFTEP